MSINDKEIALKNDALLNMMIRWMTVKLQNKSVGRYLNERRFNNIAIYGMGNIGVCLCAELKHSGVNVLYGIDLQADCLDASVPIMKPDEIKADLPVDAIVVTSIYYFNNIYNNLKDKCTCEIIALNDILLNM